MGQGGAQVPQVAARAVDVLVLLAEHQEGALVRKAEALEHPGHLLGLRRGERQRLDHRHGVLAGPEGQRRRQRGAPLLAWHGDTVVARHGAERPSASRPQRGRVRAGSGPAGPLLAPRLLAAARHLAAMLHLGGALALVREVALDGEPQQVLVHRLAEQLARQARGALLAAVRAEHLDRDVAHESPFRFITSTMPFTGPGTAPLTIRTFSSGSSATTSRFFTVSCSPPMRPGSRLPLITREG